MAYSLHSGHWSQILKSLCKLLNLNINVDQGGLRYRFDVVGTHSACCCYVRVLKEGVEEVF
jgi:hypothetical protein